MADHRADMGVCVAPIAWERWVVQGCGGCALDRCLLGRGRTPRLTVVVDAVWNSACGCILKLDALWS
jgi:hypothetical protein